MEEHKITVVLDIDDGRIVRDIELPPDINTTELVTALNKAYSLGLTEEEIPGCYLRSENPTALLKGAKTLGEYGLHNASSIYYKRQGKINE